jgi:hypothetical protein
MRVLFALAMWGERYVQNFIHFSLPTLLGDGNLADTQGIEGSHFLLQTTPEDFEYLKSSPLFHQLERTLPVEFVDIRRHQVRDKYRTVTHCQMEALRLSESYDAIVPLYSDLIWSRGGIRFAVERVSQGALAMFSPGPTILPEPAMAALTSAAALTGQDDARTISIEPHQLAAITLRDYHPMWDSFDWDGNSFTDFPACMRWNVLDQGWLIRCYHLHPVIMKVQPENPNFFSYINTTLDAEFVARVYEGIDRLFFATDTSDFALVTLRDCDAPPLPRPGYRASAAAVARWAEANAWLLHRAFANVAFRWHGGQIEEAAWQAAEARSRAIIEEVRDRLNTPDSVLSIDDKVAYEARLARKKTAAKQRRPIELPPSIAMLSRIELTRILLRQLSLGSAWLFMSRIRRGFFGDWFRNRPLLMRFWNHAKPILRPKSEIDAALSIRRLIYYILWHRTHA